jgi:hypothetical protein
MVKNIILYNELNYIKNIDLKVNIILIYNNIRNATYNFVTTQILNKLKNFISKYDCLEIFVMNHLHSNIQKNNSAIVIYNKLYEKDIQKLKNLKIKDTFDNILGKLLGFTCPNDFLKGGDIRYRYSISIMNKHYENIPIIYYTCIKENREAIKNLNGLCKKIKPIIEELNFRNISINNKKTYYL